MCRRVVFAHVVLANLVAGAGLPRGQAVTTWHNDMARTGVQASETALTPVNVNSSQFGKVFSFAVVGDVYVVLFYVSQYVMSDGVAHNVLLVATAQDYIYA